MDAFFDVLLSHAARYPLMEPVDAVKLIYQNAFGVGHLLSDPAAHLDRLFREYSSVLPDASAPLAESIGDGITRVNLCALPGGGDALSALHAACVVTAETLVGDRARFETRLAGMEALANAGALPFSGAEAAAFLAGYRERGYPMVSHSAIYKAAYRPAYRVILERLLPDVRDAAL